MRSRQSDNVKQPPSENRCAPWDVGALLVFYAVMT